MSKKLVSFLVCFALIMGTVFSVPFVTANATGEAWGTSGQPQSFEDGLVAERDTVGNKYSVTSVVHVKIDAAPEGYSAYNGEKVANITATSGGTGLVLKYNYNRNRLMHSSVLNGSAGMVDVTLRYYIISGTLSVVFKTVGNVNNIHAINENQSNQVSLAQSAAWQTLLPLLFR